MAHAQSQTEESARDLARVAGELLLESEAHFITARASNGVHQEITENATAQTEAARASIDTTLSEIETVDVAERAAELKQLEAQLEKVYLLTAQIQNQDPMNPIDSSDYATQLATFSSVEQQVFANSYLENIQSALSSSSLASVANWIGKSAKVEGKLWFDGDPVKLEFELPFDATRAELVIQTQTGNEVFRTNVDPEDRTLHWSGTQSNGANVEHGSYKAILVPYNEDDPLQNMPVYSF